MSDSVSFPRTKAQALTLLYLKNQDLSTLSPAELVNRYNEIHKEINDADKGGTRVLK